ncbi:MAG: glycosyltransferase [Deltaproteobacteria bacterium]|nr:glycosyltransferase [Deltaproteobacteria bacterium]
MVSIITITLNSEKYLLETISSVLSQTYSHFEYLIVDGGSSDRTLEIVNSFKDSRIKIYSAKDNGISDAMNRGIFLSRGEVIGFIHSDDYYAPDAIEKSLAEMKRQNSEWSYGLMDYIDSEGKFLYRAGNSFSLSKIKRFMSMNHPTVFCKKTLYEKYGVFNANYKLAMDYDLCLRFALKEKPAFVDSVVASMRLGGASSQSISAEFKATQEAKAIKNKLVSEAWLINQIDWLWSSLKIYLRHFLLKCSFGANFILKFRKFVNPNVHRQNSK